MHRGTTKWIILQQKIVVTLSFEHEKTNIDLALKLIHGMIFFEEHEVEIIMKYQ
jgi:hypothetical protein